MERSTATAYIDVQNTLIVIFVMLWVFATQHMAVQKQQGIPPKAEMMAEMTWPDDSTDDIDMWMLLPNGKQVGFTSKDPGIATLDRDDRGIIGNTFNGGDGVTHVIKERREVIAIRAIVPGKYVVNAHFYNRFNIKDLAGLDLGRPIQNSTGPVPVKAKLTKFNPSITDVGQSEKILKEVGEQVTLFSFVVTPDGRVVQFDSNDDLPFVQTSVPVPSVSNR